jgi:lysyl-tRNA synthetase class 2
VHADRRPALIARGRIRRALRDYFEARAFTEVECSALQISPGNEAHLHAFATAWNGPAAAPVPLYLHTSPEFAAKKLLAAGERRIFDFARVFRNRERGPLHAPEFTMLEWYRAEEPVAVAMEDCTNILALAAQAGGVARLSFRGRDCDPVAQAERLSVADAFRRHAGIDLLSTLTPDGRGVRAALAAQVYGVADDDSWSDIFSKVLAGIEPQLGIGHPTLLFDYPRCEAALARASQGDARLSERFELYVCGVELANGFGELTDPAEQRARFVQEMDEKARIYGERYPIDEAFLAALAAMPEACGVALGFDRLAMLAAGARRIDDVVWTPAPENLR